MLPPMIIVHYYFDRRRALASGISLTGHSIGSFIMPPLLRLLVNQFVWRGALIIHAGIILNVIVVASFYRKPVFEEHCKPEKEDNTEKSNIFQSCCNCLKNRWDLKLLKNPVFLLYISAVVCSIFANDVMYKLNPMKAEFYGISRDKAAFLPSITALCSTIARVYTSFIGNLQCVDRLRLSACAIFTSGVLTVTSNFAHDFITMVIFLSLYGLCLGMTFAILCYHIRTRI
jgi:sugar phosphate permease